MVERSLIFPAAEYQSRVERLQQRMRTAHQSALLLTSPADIFYVTGFLTRFWESPARPWFVIVPQGGAPVAVIPAIGADLMGRTWVEDIHTWDAPDPHDDGVTLLARTLSRIVPKAGHIALPMGLETSLRMPIADYERLKTMLAEHRFVDGTDTIQRVREQKSEAEIQKIKTICAIATEAFDTVPEIVSRSPTLDQIFRRFQAALLDAGADWVSYTAGGAGPGGYGDVISPAREIPLCPGDILMLDTGAVRDGYFCDFDRNFAIGQQPDHPSRAAQESLFDATDVVLETIRPGMLARDIHALFDTELSKRGTSMGSGRVGHGLGITLTEWPSFTDRDETMLVENMVLTLEPSAMIGENKMIVHEENIVLRADGAELLSRRAPRQMPVIPL